jgi:hypothetical protein
MARFESVTSRGSRWVRAQHALARRGRGALAVFGLAACIAMAAFTAPATATSKQTLIGQAKVIMGKETAADEAHHIIPYKAGTKFVVACAFGPDGNIHCNEHAGPERCVKGRPWITLSDIFPVIDGSVGQSLAYGLVPTDNYCRH